jgi:hypothetical protein
LEERGEIQDKLEGVAGGYPLTEYHVRQARQAGITPEERVADIEKAAKEELIVNQTCRVAESVTVTKITCSLSSFHHRYLLLCQPVELIDDQIDQVVGGRDAADERPKIRMMPPIDAHHVAQVGDPSCQFLDEDLETIFVPAQALV